MLLESEPDNKELNKELKDCRHLLKNKERTDQKIAAADDSGPMIEEITDEKENNDPVKKEEPPKKKGFVSVAIEESSDEEEEESNVPIREATKVSTITSKFPLKY
jgi:hypothetical protein